MKLPTIKDLNQGKWDNHFTFSIKNLGSFEFDYSAMAPTMYHIADNYEILVREGICTFNSIVFYFDNNDSEPIVDQQIKDSEIFETLIQKFSLENVIHQSEYNFIYHF